MFYLALTFSVSWIVLFGYILIVHNQIRDMKRRLQARQTSASDASG